MEDGRGDGVEPTELEVAGELITEELLVLKVGVLVVTVLK